MALAYHKKLDESTEFAIWKIEESPEELYAQLQLREHEEKVLEGLNNGKRNLHWLSTRVLLRQLLNTDEYIDCQVDEHGKPFLPHSPYHISFSHSFDYAAVIISKDKPVGIDVEIIKNKIERVARKFLISEEIAFIDQDNKIEHLYICWCAKEAIYKLQGRRNVSFKDNIRLQPFAYHESGSFRATLEADQECKTFDVFFERFENYMIGYVAGCTETPHLSAIATPLSNAE
ncbi:MAG: 4'-phosphopantetheinyl transferase superfamily protein [Sphingobacteriaceae bacterium]|nr:4'-phosphopantetheinyl transferase superfamily protein [Sphingobacteriaceae bacterium]